MAEYPRESSGSPPLAGAEAEARHATILKCDLVGSTRARKGLDLEGQLEFQRRFEEMVVDVADRHAAFIAGFEGDGALIAFGLPEPQEDDAERAIRMGLDLIAAVRSAELIPDGRTQVRVGIASGLIAVVKRPMTARGESFAGTTIDLAERLRAQANPDELVVADETKRLAGGYFVYDDLGKVACKGFDEPVRAWRAIGHAPSVSRFEAQRFDPSRSEIIGRADAMRMLIEAWTAAGQGHGSAICLRGEAGIGKSRLARAAIDRAIQDGARVLRMDCTPSTNNTPLFPVGVTIQHEAGITPRALPDDKRGALDNLVARRLPSAERANAATYLAPMFGLGAPAVPSDIGPDAFRERTIATLVQIFESIAADQPLLMVCEDLHWADDSTVSLLARLSGVAQGRAALIVMTARPTADLSAFDPSQLIAVDLAPFDASTAADLVRSVAKDRSMPDDLVRRIVERCEGVPLILEEVTRGALDASQRPEELGPATSRMREVPTPLQIIVQTRLNRWVGLIPLVQSAAVLGREFPRELLQRILPDGWEPKVGPAIDLLTQEGLFAAPDESAPQRIQFKHAMICDAVYNTLLGSDRRRLHSAAADILTREYAGTPFAATDIVAQHLARAGRVVEAIRMRLLESGSTVARGAYVETEGHCVAALALVDEVADPQQRSSLQFRLLVQFGVALTGRHGYSAAPVEDAYLRAYAVCGDTADAETLYPIMRGLTAVNLVRGELARAHELAVQALDIADRSRRPEYRLDAISLLAFTTMYFGRLVDCRKLIDECLALYGAVHGEQLTYPVPQDAATAVLAIRPTVLWLLGDDTGAEDSVRDGLAHVERLGRDFDRAMLHAWIAGYRFTRRQWGEALQHAGLALSISERHGYAEYYGIGALLALLAQACAAPNPTAVAQADATFAEFERRGVALNASYFLLGLARGQSEIGEIEATRTTIARAFSFASKSHETRMSADLTILQAEIERTDAEAGRLLENAIAYAEQEGAVATALRATALLALRRKPDAASVSSATAALAALAGQAAAPPEREWMAERLTSLHNALTAVRPTEPA